MAKAGQGKTPEKILVKARVYAQEQRARMRAKAAAMSEDEKRKHVAARLLYHSKWRAKRDGLEFNLTAEDIVVPLTCPLLGIPLVLHYYSKLTKGGDPAAPSLDRLNPKKGYVKGNVAVISYRANSLKRDASLSELESLVENLRKLFAS